MPKCDALFKSERGGDRGPAVAVARIDCDRPEETCTPPLSVWGFSRCPPPPSTLTRNPPQINFYSSGFGVSAVGSPKQAKQLSADSPRQSRRGASAVAIDHSSL